MPKKLSTTTYLILGFATAIVSIFLLPPIFGIIAIYCGYKLRKSDATLGLLLIIVALITMGIGMYFGALSFLG